MQSFFQSIRQQLPVSEEEEKLIAPYFTKRTFKRKELLLAADTVANYLYFVTKGVLHMYYISESGSSHSCHFFVPGDFATDLESFSKKVKATNYIEALTATECYQISCANGLELMERSPVFNAFVLKKMELIAMDNISRTKDLLSLKPEDRYEKLQRMRPDIIQTVPQKYIARFLGISPESLSRIRGRIVSV